MLIYPYIGLRGGRCVSVPRGLPGKETRYSSDPADMVKLLRRENSKALHIVDLDGAESGQLRHHDVIGAITAILDIPVQVAGGIRDRETADALFNDLGVARIVLTTAMFENVTVVRDVMLAFGPRRVAIGMDIRGHTLFSHAGTRRQEITLHDFTETVRLLGAQRVVVTSLDGLAQRRRPDTETLLEIAHDTGSCITAAGYVWGYPDLKHLHALLPRKIDSVILDEPLYRNAFPCQRMWRMGEDPVGNEAAD